MPRSAPTTKPACAAGSTNDAGDDAGESETETGSESKAVAGDDRAATAETDGPA